MMKRIIVKWCKVCSRASVCAECGLCMHPHEGELPPGPKGNCPACFCWQDALRLREFNTTHSGKRVEVYVYPDSDFTHITGYARAAMVEDLGLYGDADYSVNWPSTGTQSTTNTRKFAEALVAACDWVDEEQKKETK
jgi:hypothetical protein